MKKVKLFISSLPVVPALFAAGLLFAVTGWAADAVPPSSPASPGASASGPQRPDNAYSSIIDRGVFGEAGGPASVAAPSAYRLVGTITGKRFSGAVLADSAGVQTLYLLNEQLPDGSRIVNVKSDHIVVQRSDGSFVELSVVSEGKGAFVAAPPPAPAPAVAPHGADPSSGSDLSGPGTETRSAEKRRRRSRNSREE